MASFDHLPPLCLEVVGERLVSLFSERSVRHAAAACAASLALVGDERFSELSRALYDAVVDPGCVAAARAAAEADGVERARAASTVVRIDAATALAADSESASLASLRAACKDLGQPTSGTKRVLLERLAVVCPTMRASRTARLAMPPRAFPSCACPVRAPTKALVRALRVGRGVKRVNRSSTVRHGLTFEDIAALPCDRGVGRTQLYDLVDVLEVFASKARLVTAAEVARTAADVDERACAAEARTDRAEATRVRLRARRRAELDTMLADVMLLQQMQDGPGASEGHAASLVTFERAARDTCSRTDNAVRQFLWGSRSPVASAAEVRAALAQAAPKADRRRRLGAALAAVGCEMRSDSRMCAVA
jgi:hypothetical protein